MSKEIIKTKNAPDAIGPYSQAVEIPESGLIFVSGQLPINPKNNEIGSDIKTQTFQSLKNIKEILNKGNYSMDNIVKMTVFLKDINEFKQMNEVYETFFTEKFPARCAVQVACLPKDAKIEIEAIANK
jgi:2-iminobutanoate/2-iminopropanoate deaminase